MSKFVVVNPFDEREFSYDLGGKTFYLKPGENEVDSFEHAQHVLGKFQNEGVTVKELAE